MTIRCSFGLAALLLFISCAVPHARAEEGAGPKQGVLSEWAAQHDGHVVFKWEHYLEIYERHLERFRNTDVTIVEIGVANGGSLEMWRDYFGPKARIIGIDINPKCKAMEEEDQIEVFIGNQADREFLRSIVEKVGRIDIVLDDGGHTMKQQKTTFEELFPHISKNGVYICEDLHTSYNPKYGGGYRSKDTFMEFSKNYIDDLNAWYSKDEDFQPSWFTKSAYSMHYYDSILIIEKRPMKKSKTFRAGTKKLD